MKMKVSASPEEVLAPRCAQERDEPQLNPVIQREASMGNGKGREGGLATAHIHSVF